MENKTKFSQKGIYNPIVDVFSKLSIELHIIIIATFIICCLNTFSLYRWHFGNLNYAIEREEKNLEEATNTADENKIEAYKTKLERNLEKTSLATVPFFRMKVHIADYTLFLMVVCYLLLVWLYKRLVLLKNLLANYLNSFDSDEVTDQTIYSLFSIVFPSFKRPYVYIERVNYVFLTVLYLLLLSNLSEIFYTHRSGKPIFFQDGFYEFLPHILITNGILLFIIYKTHQIIVTQKKELMHVRNTLLLIRWNDYSFFPGLYESFEETKPLAIKKNYIEYRKYGDAEGMSLVITVQRADTTFKMVMNEKIDLVERFIAFSSAYKSQYREKFEPNIDRYSGRELTAEEEKMKDFFKNIIINDSNPDHKIPQDYKKIIGTDSDKSLSIKGIKKLIAQDKIIAALENILVVSTKHEKTILQLKRDYEKTENDYISGLTTLSDSRIAKNQVVDRVLKLIEKVETN